MCCISKTRQSIALAVNEMHGRSQCSKMHYQLQLKKTKVRLYLLLIWQQKALYALHITKEMEHFSFVSYRW